MRLGCLLCVLFALKNHSVIQLNPIICKPTIALAGLLLQVAEDFYDIKLSVKELPAEPSGKDECNQYRFRLNFNNRDWLASRESMNGSSLEPEKKMLGSSQPCIRQSLTSLSSNTLMRLFPFAILFRSDLRIVKIGRQLKIMFPDDVLINQALPELAKMRRPKIELTWENVIRVSLALLLLLI